MGRKSRLCWVSNSAQKPHQISLLGSLAVCFNCSAGQGGAGLGGDALETDAGGTAAERAARGRGGAAPEGVERNRLQPSRAHSPDVACGWVGSRWAQGR